MSERADGRARDALRPTSITLDAFGYAEGTALIRQGNTCVLCSASVEAGVPPFLRGQGQGWVTAEYALLPRSTNTRNRRERNGASGRTQEIQRLIGRSLRMAVDLTLLGEYTITIDCDVLQADGGTRTAAITGGYVALARAVEQLQASGAIGTTPLVQQIAAVSVGMVRGVPMLDLDYSEDSAADVDSNIVRTASGAFIEVQTTAERRGIDRATLNTLLDLAEQGTETLLALQRTCLTGGQK